MGAKYSTNATTPLGETVHPGITEGELKVKLSELGISTHPGERRPLLMARLQMALVSWRGATPAQEIHMSAYFNGTTAEVLQLYCQDRRILYDGLRVAELRRELVLFEMRLAGKVPHLHNFKHVIY